MLNSCSSAGQRAAVSTVRTAVATILVMVKNHGHGHGDTVHVVGNRVVGHHKVDTHDDGEVRLVRDVVEFEVERAVRRVVQLEDNDDGRRRRRGLCSCLRISSSEEQRLECVMQVVITVGSLCAGELMWDRFEYRGCGHADGHVHALVDLADVSRVVVRHDRVDDDNDVQLEIDSSCDGDRFVVA
jgi:hypothetical protein